MRGPRERASDVSLPSEFGSGSAGVLDSAAGTESVAAVPAIHGHRSRRAFSRWPFAWPDVFAENLMTKHGDGRLAGRQAVLRQQVGDGTIRRAFLSQFNDDLLSPGANPGTSAAGAA